MENSRERLQPPDAAMVDDSGRHAAPQSAPVRRGIAAAVAVAVLGIGAGTWFLGSGPDSVVPSPADAPVVAVLPATPVGDQAPALSVAPAPSQEAYAAARRADRAYKRSAAPQRKAAPTGSARS